PETYGKPRHAQVQIDTTDSIA
ncbi:MAG: hypothetical protein QOI58_2971, partial [Thermoanaerobaculia bacterium]|nr:hypothetical protein [Thermoanaerobaculia bacterium]MEA2416314.1 hypothetical protein [Thermoanaerobaculia bacterium]